MQEPAPGYVALNKIGSKIIYPDEVAYATLGGGRVESLKGQNVFTMTKGL